MIKAVIEKDGIKAYFDFCDSWDKIHKAIQKIDSSKNITDIRFNDVAIRTHITRYSQDIFKNIAELIQPTDRLFDVYSVCKIIQENDKDYNNQISKEISNYKNLRDIEINHTLYLYKKDVDFHNEAPLFVDPHSQTYEVIKLFSKEVLFTPLTKLPKGIYQYEVRNDEKGNICQIASKIIVNHWGTILSGKEIKLISDGYRNINEDKNIQCSNKPNKTLNQYIKELELKKKHLQSR